MAKWERKMLYRRGQNLREGATNRLEPPRVPRPSEWCILGGGLAVQESIPDSGGPQIQKPQASGLRIAKNGE